MILLYHTASLLIYYEDFPCEKLRPPRVFCGNYIYADLVMNYFNKICNFSSQMKLLKHYFVLFINCIKYVFIEFDKKPFDFI